MPTKIVYGENSFKDVDKYINGRKTLLITSNGFVKRGLVQELKSLTDNIVDVISEVKSHPEFKDLEVTYNKINTIDFELILAIGGGSVLDASKLFSVQNDKKEYQFVEDIIKGKIPKKDYKIIPIIAVPTTGLILGAILSEYLDKEIFIEPQEGKYLVVDLIADKVFEDFVKEGNLSVSMYALNNLEKRPGYFVFNIPENSKIIFPWEK